MHETPLISTIVAALVLAFVLGAIAHRLRMPPLIGYLLAGVAVGPFTPGFVADQELALELSEIGVILLMFGVGLNFSLRDLISVQAVAIPGAIGRIIVGTLMGMGLAYLMGWPLFAGIILGLALSVASTVVLLKALQDRHLIDSERGRIAVGWVIVEDIAMVLALVLIPAFAPLMGGNVVAASDPFVTFVERIAHVELGIWGVVGVTVVKLAAFVGFMLVVGRRLIPMLLHFTAHTGSRELFRLAVLAIALGVAAGSAYLFGVSLALGAFFAGMILSESELSHRAAEETLPLRDAFSVLFFVAVGMLFDPSIFVRSPLPVLGVLFIVLIGKSAAAFLIMVLFRRSVSTALTISASLAQVGEFSFVLAALGMTLGLLPSEGRDLILAGAMVSILLNPLAFWAAEHLRPALEARFKSLHPELAPAAGRLEPGLPGGGATIAGAAAEEEDSQRPTSLSHHTVLIGYGRVGTVIGEGLQKEGRPFVLIEDSESRVQAARAAGIETIVENAATPRALRLANAKGADTIIVAIPNAFEAGQATEQSRKLNANARIIVRAHSDEEEAHLKHLGANGVVLGEREIGMGMLDIVRAVPLHPEATSATIERALGKALDLPTRRGPAGPEAVAPPPSTVTAGAAASIEAALGRALELESPPASPQPPPPLPPLAEDEKWLLEPAIERAEAEHLHADELPEDQAVPVSEPEPVATTAAPVTDYEAVSEAEPALEPESIHPMGAETASLWTPQAPPELAAEPEGVAEADVAALARDDAVEIAAGVNEGPTLAEDEEAAAPPVVEPYPDYWGAPGAPAAAPEVGATEEQPPAHDDLTSSPAPVEEPLPVAEAEPADRETLPMEETEPQSDDLALAAEEEFERAAWRSPPAAQPESIWDTEPEPVALAEEPVAGDPSPVAPPAEFPVPASEPVEPPQPSEVPATPQPAEVPPQPAPAEAPWWSPTPEAPAPEIPAHEPAPAEAPVPQPEPAEPAQPQEAPDAAPAPAEVPAPSDPGAPEPPPEGEPPATKAEGNAPSPAEEGWVPTPFRLPRPGQGGDSGT